MSKSVLKRKKIQKGRVSSQSKKPQHYSALFKAQIERLGKLNDNQANIIRRQDNEIDTLRKSNLDLVDQLQQQFDEITILRTDKAILKGQLILYTNPIRQIGGAERTDAYSRVKV